MPREAPSPDTGRTAAMAGTILVLGILHLARDVLIPIATALLLTFVLTPMTRRLQLTGLGRAPSAFLVVLVSVCLVGGLAGMLGGQLYDLAANMPRYKQNIRSKLTGMQQHAASVLTSVGVGVREVNEMLDPQKSTESRTAPVPVTVVEPPPGVLQVLRSMVGPLLVPMLDGGIVLVFLLFMLIQREDLRDRLIRLIGQGRLSVTTQALDDAAKKVSRYLTAQFGINAGFAALVALGLWWLGVPNALLWGLTAGVLRFIPFLGPWIALLMPLAVSFAVSPHWSLPLSVLGLFAVLELVTSNVVEPLMYGQGTGLSTLAVVVSAVFWTWMWGPVGLLLATPLTVCVVVVSRYVPQLEFIGVLLGDERALEPHAHFYQRLLATDQVEAAEVVDGYLEDHSLANLYDAVIVPALSLAEEDRHRGGLSEESENFVVQSVRELVDDLAERHAEPQALRAGRVVCLPARDEADATAARMLAQLIEARGGSATTLSRELLSGEMLEHIAREEADVIVISAIPPFAVMHASYLCKRVRRRFPDTPVVVGLWNVSGESSAGYKRLAGVCGDRVATSLAQAVDHVLGLLPGPSAVSVDEAQPADEDDRVKDLEALALLDTEPEPAFDELVQGVARSLAVPIACIALVDGLREWWKAHVGLPGELAQTRSTVRVDSLAARVVRSGQPVYIPDLRRDLRALASPVVSQSHARSFAGVPLRGDSGHVIGALWVMDTRVRTLTTAEVEVLELAARSVMTQVKLRSALNRARTCEVRETARSPLDVAESARRLQHRLLPAAAVSAGGCRVSHLHRDAVEGVSGFLDVLVREDGRIALLLADIVAEPASSHSLAATLKTSFARATATSAIELLRALEQDLARVAQPGELVTATAVLVNPDARTVALASAGHPSPLRLGADCAPALEAPRTEPLLAASRHSNGNPAPEEHALELAAGERLLFFSDGAVEVEDDEGELLGLRGLAQLVSAQQKLAGEELLRALVGTIDASSGRAPRSDLVLALVEWPFA